MQKKVLALLLASFCASTQAFSAGDAVQVVAGIFSGVVQSDDLVEIEQCMENGDRLMAIIQDAVADFQNGSYVAGIEDLGSIFNQIPMDLSDCEDIQDDVTKFEAWASIFEQPKLLAETIAENLLTHYSEITGDIHTALSDWNSTQYYDFGDEIAQALVIAVKVDNSTTNDDCHGDDCPGVKSLKE